MAGTVLRNSFALRDRLRNGKIERMAYQYKRESLSRDEVRRLEKACESARERMLIWTLLDTGLRVSEFTSLSRDNIDWQGGKLIIFGKGGPYGSKTKRRIVPMSNRVRPMLESFFAMHDKIGYTPRRAQQIVKTIANRAEISKPVSPHVLRHTYATTCVQKGISLASLMKLLGHDKLETTAIYQNMAGEDVVTEFNEKW